MHWRVPFFKSPVKKKERTIAVSQVSSLSSKPSFNGSDDTLQDNLEFQHYEQTTNIQLFFDLFFVANLTIFTARHEINGIHELTSYLGFFCILWFTWCQVTLYDVRFATDSIFERIAHIIHFAAMIGLATVGPRFNPRHASEDVVAMKCLQALSLILMTSRIMLLLQYLTIVIFTWKYRKTRLPLMLVILSLAITAALYGTISIPFAIHVALRAYIAWYFIVFFEVGTNILIAMKWRAVSFENTHLVERMSCLTLIVLGEGIIGLTTRIALIQSLDFVLSPATIGSILSSLLIISFIYMLYFDIVPMERFGRVRQQLWAFLHFPFHMALVLLLEGTNQFVIWRHIIEVVDGIYSTIATIPSNSTVEFVIQKLNDTSQDIFEVFPPHYADKSYDDVDNALQSLNSSSSPGEVHNAITRVTVELYKAVFENYRFEPLHQEGAESLPLEKQLDGYYGLFTLVFLYFLVASGCVLISLAVITWISTLPEDKNARRYIGIFANLILGCALLLLCTMRFTPSMGKIGNSPYMLPLYVFVLFASLLFNHIPQLWAPKNQNY